MVKKTINLYETLKKIVYLLKLATIMSAAQHN